MEDRVRSEQTKRTWSIGVHSRPVGVPGQENCQTPFIFAFSEPHEEPGWRGRKGGERGGGTEDVRVE